MDLGCQFYGIRSYRLYPWLMTSCCGEILFLVYSESGYLHFQGQFPRNVGKLAHRNMVSSHKEGNKINYKPP